MPYSPDIIEPPFYPIEATVGEKELIIPAVRIAISGVEHVLTWANTTIREFDDSTFDHIELDEEDKKSGIWCDEDFIQGFRNHLYPVLFLPYVDSDSFEWFVSMASRKLEEELGL